MFDRGGWEDWLATAGLASSTTAMYRALGQRLADWCLDHDVDPHAPTAAAVRAWSDTLTESRSMRDQARATVRLYAEWCGLDGDVLREAVWRPTAQQKPRWRSLPLQAVRDLHAAAWAAGDAGTAVLIGLYAALRRSEIAGVRWDKLDLESGVWEVWRPKNRDWHLVPIAPRLAERLDQRRPLTLDVGGIPWVFPGRYGGHVSPGTVSKWVARVAAAAGHPEVTPHQLRHTCATAVYDGTRDLVLAQTLLGHQRPETTARYVRPNRAALADAVRSLDWVA